MKQNTKVSSKNRSLDQKVRRMAVIAMMGAVSAVLMFFSFNVPFMPGFIKLDFSELPALIATFSLGPSAGAMVCLIKDWSTFHSVPPEVSVNYPIFFSVSFLLCLPDCSI